jgi:hypothetical protein
VLLFPWLLIFIAHIVPLLLNYATKSFKPNNLTKIEFLLHISCLGTFSTILYSLNINKILFLTFKILLVYCNMSMFVEA